MGVPVFFKWLSTRNPKLIRDAVQPLGDESVMTGNPVIDNFYIDMNGLIHPSCNPKGENIKIPTNFEEQCENIYEYIDKLMNIVRPKKTLYLAIDGVAPRAKMNQQRSRRFRAAFQGSIGQNKKIELLEKFRRQGAWSQQLQDHATKKKFDSNVITPGTQFLSAVCVRLRQYIKNRLENHAQWKNLIVVFSDANCPGQGQHKIMDFIRQQRSSSQYNPYQSHCIYGADADLIMLSLATHEPKFYIIRQVVITEMDKFCTNCLQRGHYFFDCQKTAMQQQHRISRQTSIKNINVKFQFLRIQMVREYIHIYFMRSIIPFGYDLQRIIDDFIFMCFFVGNDFLPHVPCLSIREGGIDVLMKVYEYCLSIMPDYITKAGDLNMKSLKIFIQQMSFYEDPLVREMIIREANNKQRQINNRNFQQRSKNKVKNLQQQFKPRQEPEQQIDIRDPIGSFQAIMQKLNKQDPFNLDDYSVFNHNVFNYKEKFYREKFKITPSQFLELKSNVSKCYLQALKWICAYYYKGVPSWSWFYPFHYSPFFTDLIVPEQNIPQLQIGAPFKPFEQLMAVLPARTCDAVPQFLHYYMKDVRSPIIDYYPQNFHIDLVGKKFAWLGQVILPFIDDKRLLTAIQDYQKYLTKQQQYRNRFGVTNVYINKNGRLGRKIASDSQIKLNNKLSLNWQNEHDIQGDFLIIQNDDNFVGFIFEQPVNRVHLVSLKQGSNNNPLQQIDDDFISKTDKAAFGGIRYAKIVQTVMYQRKQKLRLKRSDQEQYEFDKQDRRDNNLNRNRSQDSGEKPDRSRQKYRNYQPRNYSDNQRYQNQHQNQNQRDYQQTRQYRPRDNRQQQYQGQYRQPRQYRQANTQGEQRDYRDYRQHRQHRQQRQPRQYRGGRYQRYDNQRYQRNNNNNQQQRQQKQEHDY